MHEYEHTIRPHRFNYMAYKFMAYLFAAVGVVLVLARLLSIWNLPPDILWFFVLSGIHACIVPLHGLTVRVSADEVVESWGFGVKERRFRVSDIREPAIGKSSDDFDLVQFKVGDGSMAQLRSDEPQELLAAIHSVISSGK